MFKVLLVYSICAVIVCRSATLQETLQTAMSDIIVNGINMSLSRLKEEYQQKIRQLKTEATSCVIGGSCSDILRKIENLKKGFYQDADQLKNSEMRTMQTYQRQINIRCIDCIADYIDDIFSDFCDEMDEELAPNVYIQITSSSSTPPDVVILTSTTDATGGNETKIPQIVLNNSTNTSTQANTTSSSIEK